ncbi:contractile injection system protein, VgrG/Pvc8 family [Clostridium frigidicarnis]|uniref:Phage late control gene D protein (GPD) n=1 Tax=Clostridium frigidicarnis TaxID=84698 RepID=A0A1I0VUD7_9CLOT|nr:contractile injection system protein, VgrG/Pvc8 family [Clostridium frigidicarnis]SFA80025.1 Phage late control gene D protein (GPD) [Clostridium frigidicarnis]
MGGFHNLKVESPYNILSIENIKIKHKPNEHGYLYIKGIVDDSYNFAASISATSNDFVGLYEENGQTIFQGLVENIKTTNNNGIYYIELECISSSFLLDLEKKSRSFQDIDAKYQDIIEGVITKSSGSIFSNNIDENYKTGKTLVQYNETDWEFIKRIASEVNSVILCDIIEKRPKINFGLPNENKYTIEENIRYKVNKNLLAFKKAGGDDAGFHDTDFFSYEIESINKYMIGDEITFRNKKMYVSQLEAYMDKGILTYKYKLCRKKGIRQQKIHNNLLKGISLQGKVIETSGEKLKLHLDIDKEQSSNAAWFPFAPATSSAMYCMPKVGTFASLYFPNSAGENPSVTGCVRKNGGGCDKFQDPNKRCFGTEHGSELELTPSSINIKGGSKEPLNIKFEDGVGVTLTSHKKLKLDASEEISITGKNVLIKAESQLLTKKTGVESGISIENEYHFLSDNVMAEATDRTTYEPFDDEPQKGEAPKPVEPEKKEEKKGFSWGKLLVVAAAAVVIVASVATFGIGAAVLAGAVIGAAIGVASTAMSDKANNTQSSPGTYLENALKGALVGALVGAIMGPLGITGVGGSMLECGLFGGLDEYFGQVLGDRPFDPLAIANQFSLGAITAGIFHGLGKVGGKLVGKAKSWLGDGFSRINNLIERASSEGAGEAGWDMLKGGGYINGRRYSQHAMERMAPDTPQVRAELEKIAADLAKGKGLEPQTKAYSDFVKKYVDPRNIPPSVIEDAIKNTTSAPGKYADTFIHETGDVTVVVNGAGDVITVIPK